jgi:glycosyltransferase involved in cell wall biosynthesis
VRVSVITPTRNRQAFLPGLVRVFRAQSHPDKELLILDDSPTPCAELGEIIAGDGAIRYVHTAQSLTIGEKRNRLIDLSRGEHIVQFDDDDYYAPNYLAFMAAQLERVDFFKLNAWYLLRVEDDFFGYWDTRMTLEYHYVVSPGEPAQITNAPFLRDPAFLDNAWGFGFSYAFRKSLTSKVRFDHRNWGEDYDFFLRLRAAGFRVDAVPDATGLALHIIHRGNTSRAFPQYRLPSHHLKQIFGEGPGDAGLMTAHP